ncbi:acylphosphatase-2 isoform X1 [Arvicanthis niloticus]|uniref:acylphosphatase-2 isoform X1 n=1 Tax=Arvicanthis niloticus TaxID=61156 RepID=UPI00402B706A
MSLLPLAAVARSAPHNPLRLLARRLAAMAEPLKSVDYEVFGTVQGVCFRMYTEGEAKKRGLVGWVKNTRKGTVTGQVQGPEEKVNSIWPEGAWKSFMQDHRDFPSLKILFTSIILIKHEVLAEQGWES